LETKGESESTIVITQDQAISSIKFKNKILKEEMDNKCQFYKGLEEPTVHLSSGCPILAKNEYVTRHDRVGAHLHYSICETLETETTQRWQAHTPKPVCEHQDITVLWNQGVHTDNEFMANWPDIISAGTTALRPINETEQETQYIQ
jgi:hypothetical protein